MKQKALALALVLVMALALCACGGDTTPGTAAQTPEGALSGGTWAEREAALSELQSYNTDDMKGPIPAEWTMPEDFTVDDSTRVEVNGDKVLYGTFADGWLTDGFTVATYADGTLTTIYEFKDGLAHSWQRFFSPDGSKLAILWKTDADAEDWNLTLVDLASGEASGVELPDMSIKTTVTEEEGAEPKEVSEAPYVILCKWQDDSNLIVTSSPQQAGEGDLVSWVYTLPEGK